MALVAIAEVVGDGGDGVVGTAQPFGGVAHAEACHVAADGLAVLAVERLSEMDGVDACGRRDLLHRDPVAEALMDVVAGALERWNVARSRGEWGDSGEDLEGSVLDFERVAILGIAMQRQQLPGGGGAGKIAHGAESRPVDIRPFEQLGPELEHQEAYAGRADGVLMLELRRVENGREALEGERALAGTLAVLAVEHDRDERRLVRVYRVHPLLVVNDDGQGEAVGRPTHRCPAEVLSE